MRTDRIMNEIHNDISRNGFKLIMRYRMIIMGIATLWIYIFHAWIPVFHEPSNGFTRFLQSLEVYIQRSGFYGVDIFLLLSGMGVMFAIKKESLINYYYRRVRRVLLPFLVAALIRWPFSNWSVTDFIGNVTGYSFYTKHIHSFCWYVPAIMTLYIVFPLYHFLFSKAKNKFVFTTLAVTLWFALSIFLDGILRFDLYGFTNRIPIFIIGVFFGYLAQDHKEICFKKKHYLLLLGTLAAGLFLAYMYIFNGFELILPEEHLIIPGILISVSLSFLAAKLMAILEQHVLRFYKFISAIFGFLGNISLESYCITECLVFLFMNQTVKLLYSWGLRRIAVNLIVFIIVSAIAWIARMLFKYLWKLIELPFKKKKAKTKAN